MMNRPRDVGDLQVRDAELGDAGQIAEILNETIDSGRDTMDLTLKTPAGVERQMREFGDREVILLLERAGATIGCGFIRKYSPRIGYRFAAETSVFLRRSEIRKGYGTFLKKAVIERCRTLGYHHLVARIWTSNAASIEYNKRLGYELVGIQREVGHVDGEWIDVAVMQLVLD